MRSWAKHPLRVTGRLLWLGGELVVAAVNYARWCAFSSLAVRPMARATWLQNSSRRVLRIFGTETSVAGAVPCSGLLVCNHLSYLDILILAALTPSRFVAKSEVRTWPVFGWFARLAGTIFVTRNRRSQALRSAEEIGVALTEGTLVVLFPEGTSSGGESVLPFKSSLLEPAARYPHALTVGSIGYGLEDGNDSEEVCYWKNMTLVPHLINLLSKRSIRTSVKFSNVLESTSNRKVLACKLQSEVIRLKFGATLPEAIHSAVINNQCCVVQHKEGVDSCKCKQPRNSSNTTVSPATETAIAWLNRVRRQS